MRGREFQRAAAAAFLPVPAASFAHAGGLGRLTAWMQDRIPGLPHGGGERAAEALGGAGAVKAAAFGSAVVIAGGSLTSHIVHAVVGSHAPSHHRVPRVQVPRPVVASTAAGQSTIPQAEPASRAQSTPVARTPHRRNQPPPSKSLGYLALGGSSAGGSGSPSASGSSSPPRATIASSSQSIRTSSPSSEASPQPSSPSHSGGGTSLGYLGK
jgi:hypothetical protein